MPGMISGSMAPPSLQGRAPSRSRVMAAHMVRHREQAARDRQKWDLHDRNWKEMNVRTERQVAWSSNQSYQKSMSAYERRSQEEEKKARLEQRRNRLRAMFQEEEQRYEAELKKLNADRRALEGQRSQEKEAVHSAENDYKHTGRVRKDCWGKNNCDVQNDQSTSNKDPPISQGQEQISERKQHGEAARQEEPLHKGCERTQRQALDRMTLVKERKEEEEQSRGEELQKLMQELKLMEEETTHLKKEQEVLQLKQHELEKIADQMRAVKQKRKESEIRQFLQRHYRAQLKHRTQQVQNELEFDRNILERLLSEEQNDTRTVTRQRERERAVADAAWMKRVIEEQLQLERERELEFDTLQREDAQRVWEKRQAQWEKEAEAREQLMHEVFRELWQQLKTQMQKNHEAQLGFLREREELIQRLELEKETRHQKREQEKHRVATPLLECQQQMAAEEEDGREDDRVQNEEELKLEMPRVSKNGYQEKIPSRARSAWT